MKIKFIFLFFLIFTSCSENNEILDCSAVTCEALNYQIKLTDNNTGENILLTQKLTQGDITIINTENEKAEVIIFDGKLIVYPKDGLGGNFKLNFGSILIEYSYIFQGGGTDCCDFGTLADVNVLANEFKVNVNLLEILLNQL